MKTTRSNRRRGSLGFALIAVAGMAADLRPAEPLVVLFTADTAGRLGPSAADPGVPEHGGLARRAALVAAARGEAPALLVLDAGNALFGGDSLASAGKGAVAAYEALRYDALNVSYRDFRLGKAATLAALAGAKFPAVSANLVDAETGAPLFKPYVVIERGGERIAVLGATEMPAGMEALPHLALELAGIRIEPAEERLGSHLERARSEAGRAVLLYYGSPAGLRSILARHGSSLAAVLAGGSRPEFLPSPPAPPIVGTGAVPGELTGVTLAGAGQGPAVRRLAPDAGIRPDPAVEKLVASFVKPAPDPLAAALTETDALPVLPSALELEKTYRLDLAAENRGARLAVLTAAATAAYAGAEAAAGRRLLLLDTRWENIIPLTPIGEQKVPTEYRVPKLADHLYLVVDGARLVRLRPDAVGLSGHVPVIDFALPRIGAEIRGNVVFEVPPEPLRSLELRFYDYAHGHLTLPLLAAAAPAPEEKPMAPLAKNEVVEAGVYRVERRKRLGEQTAPQGLEFLVLDFRARSLFLLDVDARGFDPQAKKGARLKVGTVADWKEARTHMQLVADGEYGYAPLPESTLAPEPRFLPDIMTGGEVVFLAPQEFRSLGLRCDFPNAKGPDGKVFHPAGFQIPLQGTPPALEERQPIVSIADDFFRVAVVGQEAAGRFAGEEAGEGKAFLILDVSVANAGKTGEFFQTSGQLKYAAGDGQQAGPDEATFRGPRRPDALVWIPPGERRTFQVAYRIAAGEKQPRLAYTGVSLARVVDLKPLAGAAVASAVEAPPAPPEAGQPAATEGKPPPDAGQPAATGEKAPSPRPAVATTEKNGSTTPAPPAPTTKPSAAAKASAEKLPPRVPARQPREPRGLAGVGLTAEEVNAAIDRGAEFLWNYLKAELAKGRKLGSQHGYDVLPCLALVHAGGQRRFPEFDAVLRGFLSRVDPVKDLRATYDIGLLSMLIESYGDPDFLPQLRRGTRWLLETQGPEGSWGYGKSVPPECLEEPRVQRVIEVHGGHPLDGPGAEPWARRCQPMKDADGDNSTSQYALLGLHAASRAGVKVAPATWREALAAHEKRQGRDGGWAYHGASTSYGSMTCAGICARAIARHELGEPRPAEDEGIERGLAWLSANFSVAKNPPSGSWHYYYLYSLERVGRVLDTEFIGEHEWYPLGARQLVSTQKPDGSWVGFSTEGTPYVATSFALLFLTRATAALNLEAKRGGDGILKTAVAQPPGKKYYLILDASGSMLVEMEGRRKFDIARDAVAGLIAELPESALVALRVYGHRKLAIEEGASEDTALEVPMGPLVKKALLARLAALRARGKTPLARSLLEARKDLAGAREEDPVTVVFLTDGGEDTLPRQDPLKAADEFGKLKGIVLNVVGFDINREDWSVQLQEMTRRAGGRYWPATRAATLTRELQAAVFGIPEGFTVLDGAGGEAARGSFGEAKTLKEGKYVFQAAFAGEQFREDFWVNTGATTSVIFHAPRGRQLQAAPGAAAAPAPVPAVRRPQSPAAPAPSPAAKPAPSSPAKKFCTGCGKPLDAKQRFCAACGAPAKA